MIPTNTLTPADLSLPPKFKEFRSVQTEAISSIVNSDKRFILLQGPTGVGKTLIVAAVQKLLSSQMLYICFTKQLQQQFVADFEYDIEGDHLACELMGRANYPTARYPHLFPKINASLCTARKETHCRQCCDGKCGGKDKCLATAKCAYKLQKRRALSSDIAVLNFDIFINEANYVGGFSGKFPLTVIDEADQCEHGIMDFVSLTITRKWIDKLSLPLPEKKTVEEAWIRWATDIAYPCVITELEFLKNMYGVQDLRREEELGRMKGKLEYFLAEMKSENKGKWVFIPEEDKWTWKPVFVARFADKMLWRHCQKTILMSATIISPDEMCRNLDIPKADIHFIDLPSLFDPKRRPIYYAPAAAVTHKNEQESRGAVIKALDGIIDKYPKAKILCHCTSYSYANQVMKLSKNGKRLLTYANGADRTTTLDTFKKSTKPLVLIAPSMERGVDLPGDLCSVVVVLKVPYLSLGDKQISQRLYSDKKYGQLWYTVNAVRTLVQETGRGMRSAEDSCDVYILDGSFSKLYHEQRYLFPKWWREALHGIK